MGVPFLPVRGILGSVYPEVNPLLKVLADPFSGEELAVVQALTPEMTLVHGSRGDEKGNVLIPRLSDWALAIRASRRTLATVEERVAGPVREDDDWRLIPAIHLTAVVHCPGGAAPTGFTGCYGMDEGKMADYVKSARDATAFQTYLQEQVLDRND